MGDENSSAPSGQALGDSGASDPPSPLKVFAWNHPARSFAGAAIGWSWLWLYASHFLRSNVARGLGAASPHGKGAPGESLLALAALGPALAGINMLLSLESGHGIRRVFMQQVWVRHNPFLWLFTLPVYVVHTLMWGAWAATELDINSTHLPGLASAGRALIGSASSASLPLGRAVSLLLGGFQATSNAIAASLSSTIASVPKLLRVVPLPTASTVRLYAPWALLVRGPAAIVAVLPQAAADELGWRGVLLPHLLRAGNAPLRAALVSGCLACLWQLGPSMAVTGASESGGPFGPVLAVMEALQQLPLALMTTALYLASRGSLPLCAAFRAGFAAAGVIFSGPLGPQARRSAAVSAPSHFAPSETGGLEDGDAGVDDGYDAEWAGTSDASAGGGGLLSQLITTYLLPSTGRSGSAHVTYQYDGQGWNRLDAHATLLLVLYVAALPAVAYLWWLGVVRERRRRAALRARFEAQARTEGGAPSDHVKHD